MNLFGINNGQISPRCSQQFMMHCDNLSWMYSWSCAMANNFCKANWNYKETTWVTRHCSRMLPWEAWNFKQLWRLKQTYCHETIKLLVERSIIIVQKVWNASVVDLITLLTLENSNTMTVTKFEIWRHVGRFVQRKGRWKTGTIV